MSVSSGNSSSLHHPLTTANLSQHSPGLLSPSSSLLAATTSSLPVSPLQQSPVRSSNLFRLLSTSMSSIAGASPAASAALSASPRSTTSSAVQLATTVAKSSPPRVSLSGANVTATAANTTAVMSALLAAKKAPGASRMIRTSTSTVPRASTQSTGARHSSPSASVASMLGNVLAQLSTTPSGSMQTLPAKRPRLSAPQRVGAPPTPVPASEGSTVRPVGKEGMIASDATAEASQVPKQRVQPLVIRLSKPGPSPPRASVSTAGQLLTQFSPPTARGQQQHLPAATLSSPRVQGQQHASPALRAAQQLSAPRVVQHSPSSRVQGQQQASSVPRTAQGFQQLSTPRIVQQSPQRVQGQQSVLKGAAQQSFPRIAQQQQPAPRVQQLGTPRVSGQNPSVSRIQQPASRTPGGHLPAWHVPRSQQPAVVSPQLPVASNRQQLPAATRISADHLSYVVNTSGSTRPRPAHTNYTTTVDSQLRQVTARHATAGVPAAALAHVQRMQVAPANAGGSTSSSPSAQDNEVIIIDIE